MCTLYRRLININTNLHLRKYSTSLSKIFNFTISDEVRNALEEDKPVVALESTIITHGMPYPDNVKCALDVEAIVRKQGVTPATIAITEGAIRVGLSESEINQLGDIAKSRPVKISRRDLSFVVSKKMNGGTTVSGTLVVAQKCGIPIFATGGIGGVHRGGEHTFDISADLTELGKSNVAVISSGVKSILDIGKTLEYLETQGVFVATFGSDTRDFPAFYTRKSACEAPYLVKTAQEAAEIIYCNRKLNIQSGMLFAVPVPKEFALDEEIINDVIEEALRDAKRKKIEGKNVTPFLLARIGEITGGKSLDTNISLIKNNAKVAATIALELSKLKNENNEKLPKIENNSTTKNKPVVIGGSNLDCSFKLERVEMKTDGRIHFAKSIVSGGGVGRNICEALFKLGSAPDFISVLGNDAHGGVLKNFIPRECMERVKTVEGYSTGCCMAVFDPNGECKLLVGDMEIHQQITPEMIYKNEKIIKKAPLVVFDGNLTIQTIEAILELAEHHNIPAFFEPTDVEISSKPFETKHPKAVKFISPNLNELKFIASYLKIPLQDNYPDKVTEVVDILKKLSHHVDTIIVTLGPDGVIIGRKAKATESLLHSDGNELKIRHYPTKKIDKKDIINVSGAGDCLTSGIITAMLAGLSEEKCLSVGLAAANSALFSSKPVADNLFGTNHEAWRSSAVYNTLL